MKKMILNEVGDIMENIEAVIFELIVHSGNARGMLFEALDAAEADNHEQSVMCMQQAEAEMTIAHNLQTKLIQDDYAFPSKDFLHHALPGKQPRLSHFLKAY